MTSKCPQRDALSANVAVLRQASTRPPSRLLNTKSLRIPHEGLMMQPLVALHRNCMCVWGMRGGWGLSMRVRRLTIANFRGVSHGRIDFSGHTLLVGGNNIGKSTVCEALDLVLGPERLFRRPVVDEHDFHCGRHLADGLPIEIRIEAVLVDLSEEATRRFGGHLRRWNELAGAFMDEEENGLDRADAPGTVWALPLLFVGRYDRDEDDFVGNTFLTIRPRKWIPGHR